MKKIIKSLLAVALISGVAVSCEDDQDIMFAQPEGEFRILTPSTGSGVVLDPETPANPGLSMSWEAMSYGTPTEVTYTVEVDRSGDNFDTPIALTSSNFTYATITSDALNGAALAAGLTPFEQGGLEVRVKASVGTTGSEPSYSDVIAYLVTPYSTDLPKLWVPGGYQATSGYGSNWTHATAPQLASPGFGQTNFEGYVYIANDQVSPSDPENNGFKFTTQGDWNGTNYGDDGSFAGVISATGDNVLTTAGYYRVAVDTGLLTYSLTSTTWGIIGAATPGGWDNSTALTYNAETKVWEGDVNLTAGEYKFRANNAWNINLGGFDASKPYGGEEMSYDGTNLSVAAAGNYHVVLDLSNPRGYTYSVTLN